ncbi:ABC transporter permease [Clostridium sp.]|uniref:ABC transporter permease n=1 Tax=Clostridium sp. TaxID=1506 RepID=UPI002FCAFC75
MLNLLKIEWKKVNLKGYSIVFLAILAFACISVVVTGYMYTDDSTRELVTQMGIMGDAEQNIYGTFLSSISGTIYQFMFIFCGIFGGEIFLKEYKNGTIKTLFTSPVKREKIIASKVIFYVILNFIFTLIFVVTQLGVLIIVSKIFAIEGSPVTFELMKEFLPQICLNIVGVSIAVLLPLSIVLIKSKTEGMLIGICVAAIVLFSAVTSSVTLFKSSETILNVFYVILPLLGLLSMGWYTKKYINKDVIA